MLIRQEMWCNRQVEPSSLRPIKVTTKGIKIRDIINAVVITGMTKEAETMATTKETDTRGTTKEAGMMDIKRISIKKTALVMMATTGAIAIKIDTLASAEVAFVRQS